MKIILLKKKGAMFNITIISLLIICIYLIKINIGISILMFIFINIIEIINKTKKNNINSITKSLGN